MVQSRAIGLTLLIKLTAAFDAASARLAAAKDSDAAPSSLGFGIWTKILCALGSLIVTLLVGLICWQQRRLS